MRKSTKKVYWYIDKNGEAQAMSVLLFLIKRLIEIGESSFLRQWQWRVNNEIKKPLLPKAVSGFRLEINFGSDSQTHQELR